MKIVVLCFLMVSSGFFTATAQPDSAAWSKDEIGERWVGRISGILKSPFMTLLATSEFATKQELRRRIASSQEALKQFSDLLEEEIKPKPAASVMPVVEGPAMPQTPPVPMVMPEATPMTLATPMAPAATPEPIAPALVPPPPQADQMMSPAPMATPTVAEELMPTSPAEPMTPTTELMTMPVVAPGQSEAMMTRNDPSTDGDFSKSIAERFDDLVVAELDESAQELMPLPDNESVTRTPRFAKDAKAEKMPKIQVIHDQDLMNSI